MKKKKSKLWQKLLREKSCQRVISNSYLHPNRVSNLETNNE
ncbi:MAG: hypothetical protein ACI976_002150 [Aureispira sp.]|jgi:hypothetical protein